MSESVPQTEDPRAEDRWLLGNQRYLQAELERIKQTLLRALRPPKAGASADSVSLTEEESHQAIAQAALLREILTDLLAPPALLSVSAAFALSPFERDLLLLCAAIELDPSLRGLCTQLQGTAQPTFALALGILDLPHFSALLPQSPLRQAQLVQVSGTESLTHSPLRIDERILHYLTGTSAVDHRLTQIGQLLPVHRDQAESLSPTLLALSQQLCSLLEQESPEESLLGPLFSLFGGDTEDQMSVARAACQELGLSVYRLRAADVPSSPSERALLLQLCVREQRLLHLAVLLCVEDHDPAESIRCALSFVDALPGVVLCTSPSPLRHGLRRKVSMEVPKLQVEERAAQLRVMLGDHATQTDAEPGPGGAHLLSELAQQFHLGREGLAAACLLARGSTESLPQALWSACRAQARPHLDDLARRIVPRVTWEDLILPAPQVHMLRQLVAHQRHQATVYLSWEMAGRSQRGLGVTALFVGQSGTGKTLAAEALAHELRLDLYHIDLSQIISKYIGETEKNLRRVFDAAEEGGAVLLFDEADALFGKRSEVKDSHDRYANIEVSYLLQRMESYQGISLLTSNLRSALDSAFLRRLRFIVPFPFPDAPQRAELWRRAFPRATPTQDLSLEKLARLSVTGGQIRNIALSAAFLAASQRGPVTMQHILDAAKSEYEKSERPLAEPEIRGWV